MWCLSKLLMKVFMLFDYDASFLLCFSLMIFYTMMFWFNLWFKDKRCFLCIHDTHDYNVKNCILLLNDYHSLSREICDERKTRLIVELSFHIYFLTRLNTWYQSHDLTWILNINLMTQLDINFELSQNSNSQFNSLSNWKWC